MRLIVLGSGTAIPVPDRGPSGYVVIAADSSLLLDCGSGTLQRLAHVGLDPRTISGLFISHAHLDHCADLAPLLFALNIPGYERPDPLVLHTGPGFSTYLQGIRDTFGSWVEPRGATLIHEEHDSGRFDVGEFLCSVLPVQHHATSIGIRIRSADGCTLAYLGDTDLCDNAITLCKDADIAVVECSFPDDMDAPGHLCPRKVAELLMEAQPAGAILTHLYPPAAMMDLKTAVQDHGCNVPLHIAYDGLGVAIDPPPR